MERSRIREYFNFTRKERNGIIALLGLLFLVWFLPEFLPDNPGFDPAELESFKKGIASLAEKQEGIPKNKDDTSSHSYKMNSSYGGQGRNYYPAGPEAQQFPFDPNLLTAEGWKKLGLRDKTIGTIQRYLAKGGRFLKAEDLSKIYGMSTKDYERLYPYVRIENKAKEKMEAPSAKMRKFESGKITKVKIININEADTSDWIALPGIGSKLANRIINFRNKLGGFYSSDQVAETFGLADSVFQKIRERLSCPPTELRKLNINTADFDEFRAHPYIGYRLANAFLQYRRQHGEFKNIGDLQQVMLLDEKTYRKLEHYILVEAVHE
jgi:competence protein ComEA